jgi:hypothetical protein
MKEIPAHEEEESFLVMVPYQQLHQERHEVKPQEHEEST